MHSKYKIGIQYNLLNDIMLYKWTVIKRYYIPTQNRYFYEVRGGLMGSTFDTVGHYMIEASVKLK